MSEKYTPSHEEEMKGHSFLNQDQGVASLRRQMNLESPRGARTDLRAGENQRPDLTYDAKSRTLEITDKLGKVIDTVGIGPAALNYLKKQIETEKSYLDNLLELKERIERDLKK